MKLLQSIKNIFTLINGKNGDQSNTSKHPTVKYKLSQVPIEWFQLKVPKHSALLPLQNFLDAHAEELYPLAFDSNHQRI